MAMDVVTEGNKDYVYSGRFTGTVQLEMVFEAADASAPDIAQVHSHDGAVTKWHSHPGGQYLYLVSGTGRAGDNEHDYRSLEPGTMIKTPANESHWHGAEDGADATWLAITFGVTNWSDDVPECCKK